MVFLVWDFCLLVWFLFHFAFHSLSQHLTTKCIIWEVVSPAVRRSHSPLPVRIRLGGTRQAVTAARRTKTGQRSVSRWLISMGWCSQRSAASLIHSVCHLSSSDSHKKVLSPARPPAQPLLPAFSLLNVLVILYFCPLL